MELRERRRRPILDLYRFRRFLQLGSGSQYPRSLPQKVSLSCENAASKMQDQIHSVETRSYHA